MSMKAWHGVLCVPERTKAPTVPIDVWRSGLVHIAGSKLAIRGTYDLRCQMNGGTCTDTRRFVTGQLILPVGHLVGQDPSMG